MYGSLHSSESIARLSVAGVVLWLALSALLATAVGVAAWTFGHQAGGGTPPARVTQLQRDAFTRGFSAGVASAHASARHKHGR
jgi:hypothetical protein